MRLQLKCSTDECTEQPALGALHLSPNDYGEGTIYEMFGTCATHEANFWDTAPDDLEGMEIIRFKVAEKADAESRLWRVRDNVTGAVASREFDTDNEASAICREFNTPASVGGRYHVETWIDDDEGWRRAR